MDQLNKIIDILGKFLSPSVSFVVFIVNRDRYPKRGDDHKSREPKGLEKMRTIPPAATVLTTLQAQAYIRSLPRREPASFEKLFPDADAQGTKDVTAKDDVLPPLFIIAIGLLQRMITFDPTERISVAEALEHPWLSTYHNLDDEPDCTESFQRWKEIEELESHDDFKRALWDEIQDYRREVRGLNSVAGSPVTMKRTLSASSASSHPVVDSQTQPSTTTGLGQIDEETAADLKTGTTRSSGSTSPHQKEGPVTTETSPPPPDIEPSQAGPEPKPTLPPSEPPPPLPAQDNQRSRPISRTGSGKNERRPSFDKLERASSTASITTPTDPVLTYARRSSFLQPQQPPVPNSGTSSPVNPYHPNSHTSRKPIPNFGEGGYFDEGVNPKEQYGHGKHLHRNTIAFPSGDGYVVPGRSRSGSAFGPYHSGIPFPGSTHTGDGISGLTGTANHSYTVGPGTVSRLLRTLSTVSIHESGQGLKGGLADIAPIGKFITERGTDDELLASEVPEELKEGGCKNGDKDEGLGKGRKRKSAGMFNL